MSEDVLVALIGLIGTVAGGCIVWLATRRKNKADIADALTSAAIALINPLKNEIAELRNTVAELKAENADLKSWAERLVCQVKEAGGTPVEFIRHALEEIRTKPRTQE